MGLKLAADADVLSITTPIKPPERTIETLYVAFVPV
jgi:hypothetical protein